MSAVEVPESTGVTTVSIRPMQLGDVPAAVALEQRLFADDGPWSAESITAEIEARHSRYYAAIDAAGRLVGYAGIGLLGRGSTAESEIHTIGVAESVQHRGIGRRLLHAMLADADAHGGPVFLEVRTDNEPAIALYRSEGFTVAGTRPRYYQPSGADAYTMRRRGRGAAGAEETS